MTTAAFTESVVEEAALEWFEHLGYAVVSGPSIAPGEPGTERTSYEQVVLDARLRAALARLNPHVPSEGLDEAFRKLTRIASPQLVDANHELHYYLVNGGAWSTCAPTARWATTRCACSTSTRQARTTGWR
jgi:type I restriction enzyme R subunit